MAEILICQLSGRLKSKTIFSYVHEEKPALHHSWFVAMHCFLDSSVDTDVMNTATKAKLFMAFTSNVESSEC